MRWRGRRARGPVTVAITVLSMAAFLAGWTALGTAGLLNPALLPPPSVLGETALSMVRDGYPDTTSLFVHVAASLGRIMGGYALAGLVAVPLGIVVGTLPALFDVTAPLVAFFRTVPTVSLVPVAIIALGIGETSKVALIAFGCFWIVLTNVIDGVRLVDPGLVRAGRALGATRRQLLFWVVLPAALPRIVTGLRLALGVALMVLVAAEMVASEAGLGFLLVDGRRFFRADVVLVGMLLIGAVGSAFSAGFGSIERRVLRRTLALDAGPWR